MWSPIHTFTPSFSADCQIPRWTSQRWNPKLTCVFSFWPQLLRSHAPWGVSLTHTYTNTHIRSDTHAETHTGAHSVQGRDSDWRYRNTQNFISRGRGLFFFLLVTALIIVSFRARSRPERHQRWTPSEATEEEREREEEVMTTVAQKWTLDWDRETKQEKEELDGGVLLTN